MSNSASVVKGIFRDPVSGLTHLAGAFLGAIGMIYLLNASRDQGPRVLSAMTIYGISMILLYLASSIYHLLHVSDSFRLTLRRVDHAMIPVFIAGTYTPFCMIALNDSLGYRVLASVWILSVGGLLKSLYWIHAPRWVPAVLYVAMGWLSMIMIMPLWSALTHLSFFCLLLGGLSYSVGAIIYAKKWPDPWPPIFGFHEIWHLFVLGGSIFHFAAVANLVTNLVPVD